MKALKQFLIQSVKLMPYLYLVALIWVALPAHAQSMAHPIDRGQAQSMAQYFHDIDGNLVFEIPKKTGLVVRGQPLAAKLISEQNFDPHAQSLPEYIGIRHDKTGPEQEAHPQSTDQSIDQSTDQNTGQNIGNTTVRLQKTFGNAGDTIYLGADYRPVLRKWASGGLTYYSNQFPNGQAVLESNFSRAAITMPQGDASGLSDKNAIRVDDEQSNAAPQTVQDWAEVFPYEG